MGCAPYLQIFKAGKLLFTTAATLHFHQSEEELPFVQVVDGPVPFNVEQIVQGDILIRCRHLTFSKQRVSMFRSAFHTGYVPPNVMRLTKSQLDGACSDRRFPDDFFLDLIFEKVDAETASKHLEEEAAAEADFNEEKTGKSRTKGGGPVVKASSYDSMLHGDSRFWDVISARRQEQAAHKEDDPLWGPTVGRRRGEPAKKKTTEGGDGEDAKDVPKERTQFETFSIGNEFDFLPVEKSVAAISDKKDDLMEALMALDEDEAGMGSGDLTEEIVFESGDSSAPAKTKTAEMPPSSATDSAPEVKSNDSVDGNPTTSNVDANDAVDNEPSKDSTEETAKSSAADEAVDMDSLLNTADEDLGDLDLGDYEDDGELEDLENMLKT